MIKSNLGVIFDMDGVLVDSYQAHFRSWKSAADRYGLSISESEFAATFGRTSRDIIHKLWPARFNDAEAREFDEAKEADYRHILRADFRPMAGVDFLIQSLHDAGFRLAIGSSGPPENVAVVVECLKTGKLFDATVDRSEIKHGKPDPEVFLKAARKIKLEPIHCAVIEDAPAGVEAAARANMLPIGLLGTAPREALAAHAALVVGSLTELSPKLIEERLASR